MFKLLYVTVMSVMIVLFTGCTPMVNKYRVSIDAITAPETSLQPATYVIKALGNEQESNDLHFQRQSQQLVRLLNQKGYQPATHANLAEQIIYFNYGLEKVQEERRIYQEPEVSVGISWGFPYGYYHRRYHPFWHDVGYTSYRTYERHYVLYDRYITIVAKDQLNKELWRVDVSSIGESNNLRKIIPMLINASDPYIGTNTQEPIELTIKEKRENKE